MAARAPSRHLYTLISRAQATSLAYPVQLSRWPTGSLGPGLGGGSAVRFIRTRPPVRTSRRHPASPRPGRLTSLPRVGPMGGVVTAACRCACDLFAGPQHYRLTTGGDGGVRGQTRTTGFCYNRAFLLRRPGVCYPLFCCGFTLPCRLPPGQVIRESDPYHISGRRPGSGLGSQVVSVRDHRRALLAARPSSCKVIRASVVVRLSNPTSRRISRARLPGPPEALPRKASATSSVSSIVATLSAFRGVSYQGRMHNL